VRVDARDIALVSRDLLFEDEPDVLERAALAMRVAQQREGGLARLTEDRQRVGRESRRFADGLDARSLDGSDLPAVTAAPGDRELAGTEGQPRLGEPQALIEVGERVQLHGRAVPGVLDLPSQLRREPRWLSRVARDDVVVELLQRAHDPLPLSH